MIFYRFFSHLLSLPPINWHRTDVITVDKQTEWRSEKFFMLILWEKLLLFLIEKMIRIYAHTHKWILNEWNCKCWMKNEDTLTQCASARIYLFHSISYPRLIHLGNLSTCCFYFYFLHINLCSIFKYFIGNLLLQNDWARSSHETARVDGVRTRRKYWYRSITVESFATSQESGSSSRS